MPNKPRNYPRSVYDTTAFRRRPCVAGARRARPLFKRGLADRTYEALRRWRAVLACFGAAALALAGALALPLLSLSPAAADVDLVIRAAAEVARLQDGSGELPRSVSLNVPALQQYPELPTGCESVALTNALLARGFDLGKTEIAASWLPLSGDDFVRAFMGDPFSPDGHSCMAPAVASAAAAYLAAHGSGLEVVDSTGASLESVLSETAAGNPVVAWCTIGLAEPGECYRTAEANGRTYRLLTNSHCVVVSGYDLEAGVVLTSDSLAGHVSYPLETFAARYYALGAQAVVLR